MKLQQAKFATIAMDHSSFVRSQGTAFAGSSSGSSRGRDHADSPSALACAASAHPFGPFLLAKNGLFPAVVQPMLLGKHTPNRIHGAAILMVCHGSHQYTPVMLAYIYQRHGSYGYMKISCILPQESKPAVSNRTDKKTS